MLISWGHREQHVRWLDIWTGVGKRWENMHGIANSSRTCALVFTARECLSVRCLLKLKALLHLQKNVPCFVIWLPWLVKHPLLHGYRVFLSMLLWNCLILWLFSLFLFPLGLLSTEYIFLMSILTIWCIIQAIIILNLLI